MSLFSLINPEGTRNSPATIPTVLYCHCCLQLCQQDSYLSTLRFIVRRITSVVFFFISNNDANAAEREQYAIYCNIAAVIHLDTCEKTDICVRVTEEEKEGEGAYDKREKKWMDCIDGFVLLCRYVVNDIVFARHVDIRDRSRSLFLFFSFSHMCTLGLKIA